MRVDRCCESGPNMHFLQLLGAYKGILVHVGDTLQITQKLIPEFARNAFDAPMKTCYCYHMLKPSVHK